MKIILFATYYENSQMIAARRWRSLAYYLCNDGVELYVVTPGFETKQFIGEYGETIYTFKSSYRKKGGTGALNSKPQRKVISSPFPYLDISVISWIKAFKEPKVVTFCKQSDLIISTYGPSGSMLFGLFMAYKCNKPWVLDLRDSFQIDPFYNTKLLSRVNYFFEKKIIHSASLSITVGAVLTEYLSNKYKTNFNYIYNGWLDSDDITSKYLVTKDNDYFLYAGSIYPHQLCALKVLLGSLQQELKGNVKLRIRLIRDYSGCLSQWLQKHQFESLVDIYPPIDSETLNVEMTEAKGVLVIEDLSPKDWQKGTVTGKLFSLLISGLPGIVVSHQGTELFTLASKANGWFCAYDINSCRQAISDLLKEDKSILGDNKIILSEYHFSRQAKKLMGLFELTIKEYHDSRK